MNEHKTKATAGAKRVVKEWGGTIVVPVFFNGEYVDHIFKTTDSDEWVAGRDIEDRIGNTVAGDTVRDVLDEIKETVDYIDRCTT